MSGLCAPFPGLKAPVFSGPFPRIWGCVPPLRELGCHDTNRWLFFQGLNSITFTVLERLEIQVFRSLPLGVWTPRKLHLRQGESAKGFSVPPIILAWQSAYRYGMFFRSKRACTQLFFSINKNKNPGPNPDIVYVSWALFLLMCPSDDEPSLQSEPDEHESNEPKQGRG